MENYFKKNTDLFELKEVQESWSVDRFVLNSDNYIGEVDEPTNRVLYIGVEMTSLSDISEKLANLNEKSMLFLFYRDQEYLAELLTKLDFTSYEDKVLFFAGDISLPETMTHFNQSVVRVMFAYTIMKPIIKETEDLEYIRLATEMLRRVNEYRNNFEFMLGNDIGDTLYGLRNRLLNMPAYVNNMGYTEFKSVAGEVYKGKPAVLVASGPSLDKNVHLLKDYQDKALILSCDGSLSTLLKQGIVPDVVGSVERVYRTYNVFYENRTDHAFEKDIVFSGPAVVRPEMVDIFKDHKMISVFKNHEAYGGWLDEITMYKKGRLWSGTSVAHFLYSFAEGLGCDPIILIGQDLAYSNMGLSHAGDVEIVESVELEHVETWVKDYDGKDIPSTNIWKMFLLTLEDMIRQSTSKAIDATEGGAYIEGSEIMTLKEALERHCLTELPRVSKYVAEYEKDEAYLSQVKLHSLKKIEHFIGTGEKLLKKIRKGVELNKKALKRYHLGLQTQEQLDKIYDAMEYVDNEIVKYVIKEPLLMMLFQFPIFSASKYINALKTSTYTLETIQENLDLHEGMLEVFELFTCKLLYLFNESLTGLDTYFADVEEYHKFMKKLNNKYGDILSDNKYRTIYF